MALVRSCKMENNVEIFETTNNLGELVQYVIIDRGNGEFTSMLKSVYDEQQTKAEKGTIS